MTTTITQSITSTLTCVELDEAGSVRYLAGTGSDETFAGITEARQAVIDHLTEQARQAGSPVRVKISEPNGQWRLVIGPDGSVAEDSSPVDPEMTVPEPAPETETEETESQEHPADEADVEPEPGPADEMPVSDPAEQVAAVEPAPEQQEAAISTHRPLPVPATPVVQPRRSFISTSHVFKPAEQGWRGVLNRCGLRLAPGATEAAEREDISVVSQHWVGARTIVVVNSKGGAGKTPTAALLSAVMARFGGGGVVAWDVNQLRGTLGWRTEQSVHDATVLDLVPALKKLSSSTSSLAQLAGFMHHQREDRYDVLRSQPLVLAEEQRLEPWVVDDVWKTVTKFYRVIVADTGNDESDPMWRSIVAHADQIVVATTTRNDHAEAGALLLEALTEQDERGRRLADNAVVVVTQADPRASKKAIETVREGFKPLAREVVTIPHDPGMVDGQLSWSRLAPATRRAWLAAGAAVARGL